MSWAGLASNQCVSNANLDNAITTGVFVRKSSFSDSNQELTKERAQQYVYLDENLASFLAKALNQLVVKQDLQAATIIGCGTGTYGTIQWTANTLIITTQYFNVGTTSGTLTIDYTVVSGTASIRVIYGGTTSTITGLVSTNGSATYSYTYNAGVGTTIGITFDTRQNSAVTQNFSVRASCAATTTTTTTIASFAYGGTVSTYKASATACANQTCGRSYYLASPSWSVGSTVYDDVALTTPFNGGGNWIAVATSSGYCSGGWAAIQVSTAGVIQNVIGC